ncbi:MAG: DUF2892 domain-containing protein [Candidatus Zixiibacteriota bacterium]
MKPNEGTTDRLIRLILGVVLISTGWPILGNNTLGIILDIIGIILFITGITGSCMLYKILGINTVKVPKE